MNLLGASVERPAQTLPAGVGQLGIVVQQMPAAMRNLGRWLAVRRWYRSNMRAHEVFFEGRPLELELDIVVGYSGALQIELIEVLSPQAGIYESVRSSGADGLHHVGLIVPDVDAELSTLSAQGVSAVQHGRIRFAGGGTTRYAYLDTRAACGLTVELIETRYRGINLGMPEWLMRIGTLTKDTARAYA